MARTSLQTDAAPEAVFAVLDDPWCFADWVVGAKKIRAVDATWPEVGSRFHHRFGFGPFTLDDSTVLEKRVPGQRVVLRARARPTGVARVVVDLIPEGGGTRIEIEEHPISGFAKRIHNPLLDALVVVRNKKSLQRLADLAGSRS